jgi:hypothetical protein
MTKSGKKPAWLTRALPDGECILPVPSLIFSKMRSPFLPSAGTNNLLRDQLRAAGRVLSTLNDRAPPIQMSPFKCRLYIFTETALQKQSGRLFSAP